MTKIGIKGKVRERSKGQTGVKSENFIEHPKKTYPNFTKLALLFACSVYLLPNFFFKLLDTSINFYRTHIRL